MSQRVYRVEWAAVAQRDLVEIVENLRMESRAAALKVVDLLEKRAATLYSMPLRGRVPPELLRFQVQMYRELQIPPYRLVYRVFEHGVVVLGVFDGRRNLEDVLLGRLLGS